MKIAKWFIPAVIVYTVIFYSIAFSFAGEVDLTKAVIHHTASPDWSVERIREIHVTERKFSDIGYHFIVRQNGEVETGRSIEKRGAHSRGRNNYIGIALTGYDEFSSEQLNSLIQLLERLGVRHIERHHEQCPGRGLDIEAIQEGL